MDPVQDGSNHYVYCRNNPLSMKDPTGLWNWTPNSATGIKSAEIGYHLGKNDIEEMKKACGIGYNMWKADFIDASGGGSFVIGDGVIYKQGSTNVTFTNTKTGENFKASYSFEAKDSRGVDMGFGMNLDVGGVAKYFKDNVTRAEIAKSYSGSFYSTSISLSQTVFSENVTFITSKKDENGESWMGLSFGGSSGVYPKNVLPCSGSTQVINYTNNWYEDKKGNHKEIKKNDNEK